MNYICPICQHSLDSAPYYDGIVLDCNPSLKKSHFLIALFSSQQIPYYRICIDNYTIKGNNLKFYIPNYLENPYTTKYFMTSTVKLPFIPLQSDFNIQKLISKINNIITFL